MPYGILFDRMLLTASVYRAALTSSKGSGRSRLMKEYEKIYYGFVFGKIAVSGMKNI